MKKSLTLNRLSENQWVWRKVSVEDQRVPYDLSLFSNLGIKQTYRRMGRCLLWQWHSRCHPNTRSWTWPTACVLFIKGPQWNQSHCNFPTWEQELLALKIALENWRIFLPIHFMCRTDHNGLKYLCTQKKLELRNVNGIGWLSSVSLNLISSADLGNRLRYKFQMLWVGSPWLKRIFLTYYW